jgi:Nuclease A inhibitor-like protein
MSDADSIEGRLARAFSTLLRDMLYPGSEADSPYEPFHVALSPEHELTPETLREALGLADWWTVEFEDGEVWLADVIASARDPAGGGDPAEADIYEILGAAMRGTLRPPLQLAGIHPPLSGAFHKTRRILLGRLPSGPVAGIIAYSVET